MKNIEIKNNELRHSLDEIGEWFNTFDLENNIKIFGEEDTNEYYTEDYFLQLQLNDEDHDCFGATISYGVDLNANNMISAEVKSHVTRIDELLKPVLSAPHCPVKMYYPKNGFMHWHNNHNAPGYNILLTYTKEGKGFFRYRDPQTKTTVTMHDSPGWTAKVGYYGSNEEPDKVYWHCARAYEPRLTLGYIIPHEEMWEMMCEDIQE